MPRYKEIYLSQAVEYDQLVSREDFTGNILKSLQSLLPLADAQVVKEMERVLLPHRRGRKTNAKLFLWSKNSKESLDYCHC